MGCGKARSHGGENIDHGIENAPAAFLKLFKGENFGKMLVKLG
jgi:NADPH-dependent curcumin reductase CurA